METRSLLVDPATPLIHKLEIEDIPRGKKANYWLQLISDGIGWPICVPVMVARGQQDGPVLGVTAAVHGNELNGIPIIQRLFRELDPAEMRGTVVAVPVVNVPALQRKQRRYIDNVDLNHIMPGKEDGNVSEVYSYRFVERIAKQFDYLVDLHTASFGRINSYYIRASLEDRVTRELAILQNAQIVVNNRPSDGTLRGAANALDIPAITLEVGDPNKFQKGVIRSGLTGIHNALVYLGILDGTIETPDVPPIVCSHSYWLYTDQGGILTVLPNVTDRVEKGTSLAILRNVFGEIIQEYLAPEAGIVIGKSVSPINHSGGRILHLGIESNDGRFSA